MLVLLEVRQCGVIYLLNYLFWTILFEIIGSDNGETCTYEPCQVVDLFILMTAFPLRFMF